MVIAQLDFTVSIEGVLHMRVAAIVTDSAVVEHGNERRDSDVVAFWKGCVDDLCKLSVRVLVFKDSAETFREVLHKKMQHTQVSDVCGRKPSFFVLGPLDRVLSQQAKQFYTSCDPTSNWGSISSLKLKQCKTTFEKSTRTLVFLGSDVTRRSWQKRAERGKKSWGRYNKNAWWNYG